MSQNCLKCLKYIMCAVNFLCFMSGVAVLILGVYMICYQTSALLPSRGITVANLLLIGGVIITCIAFLGFIGALKENRCFLLTFFILLLILMLVELAAACFLLFYNEQIRKELEKELTKSLNDTNEMSKVSNDTNSDWDIVQQMLGCCGVLNSSDWNHKVPASCCKDAKCSSQPQYQKGCLKLLEDFFNTNIINAGIAVIVVCVIEVLGMCFSMTLFCHISRSGLSYKI